MLVRFSSTKTEPLIMYGDIAVQLIKMMGASGSVPGAITAEDIPAAVRRLRQQLQAYAEVQPSPAQREDQDDDGDENAENKVVIGLATRAVPLLDLLERAAAGNAALMWEAQ